MKSISLLTVVFMLTIFLHFHKAQSQEPQLKIVLDISDTLVSTGLSNGLLSVYIDNYYYELFGFQFVLNSTRPDLITFNFDYGGFDSTGTMTSGFEYMEAIDRASDRRLP